MRILYTFRFGVWLGRVGVTTQNHLRFNSDFYKCRKVRGKSFQKEIERNFAQ